MIHFFHLMAHNWSHFDGSFWTSLAEVLSPGHVVGELLVFETGTGVAVFFGKRWLAKHDRDIHGK